MFELFQSHLRSVKKEIEKYSNSIPTLANYTLVHSQRLQDKMEHPQYVISVAGSSKSGKSTFLNALLGEDFIPNGATLRSYTGTSILFADHDNQVCKQWNNGQVEVIKGNPLPYAFHQEMKNGWKTSSKDAFQYVVRHKLHALSSNDPHDNIDFIVIDTPSVDLETNEEQTLSFFEEAMRKTDLLLYVFDGSNPTDKQTLRLIEEIRPDLLEDAVFIVNKMDHHTTVHIDMEATMQDISYQLQSFGIHNPNLYPVSSKTALYTRMIQKEMSHSEFYWQELASYVPIEEMEEAENEDILIQSLLEKSGMETIEQEILLPVFYHIKEAIRYSLQKGVMRHVEQMSKDFEKNVQKLSWYVEQKQIEKSGKEEHLKQLTSLIERHNDIAERLKEQVQQAASLLKKDETMRPYTFTMPSYAYHSTNEGFETKDDAIDEARKLLALWMKNDIERIPENVSTFYNTGLQYEDTSDNYFQLIYDVARKELARVNQAIYEYGLKYPKTIDFITDPERVETHQMEIGGKRAIVRNMKMYDNKIDIESYETPYKDKVLLVFHKTKYVKKYKYNIEAAVHFAETDLNEKISNFSEMYYEEYILEKYENYPKRVVKSARKEIERSLQIIEILMIKMKEDMKKVDEELKQLQDEIALITELQHRIGNRSKLLTATERMSVNDGESVTKRLDQAKTGTTFFLEEGEFILHVSSLSKSAAFVGKGKEKTKLIIKESVFNSYNHDSFLFEDLAIVFEQPEDVAIKIDGYSFIAENCSFTMNTNAQTILEVNGDTEGSINNCIFNGGLLAVSIHTNGVFTISSSAFINNETAIMLGHSMHTSVYGNYFKNNEKAAIDCKENANARITENRFSNQSQYSILCRDQAKPAVDKNEIIETKVCAIYITDEAKPMISENSLTKNKTGVLLEKFAKATLRSNKIAENAIGILACNDSELSLTQNTIENNTQNGVLLSDTVSIPVCKQNMFLRNKGTGFIIGGAATGKIEDNQFDSNEENGIMLSMNAEMWLVNNTISHHAYSGVLCEGSSHLIMVQNEVEGNGNGVQLKDKASVEIENNTFIKNKRYGIRISDSVTGVVNGNECSENGLSAFWVDTVKEMEFNDNKQVESGFAILKPQYWNCKMKMQRSNQKAKRIRRSKQMSAHA